ncbi:two component transcriptional regulator, LuxR family [Flavobacterium succinicans]|jgi:DNA-binding NarL/FixJ family response regulator|uniref:Two component transcriptional regulator, LuxR family n=1 Tax=Flavobacterium succinicans TaxID=29536 RepID=A0A1I4YNY0_9FLAO|nr:MULTISPECIES: response regulator transcription factor [Flavobacterium]OOV26311.1 DNA-binding response regulator [Flavobacterium sp. LM5]SFN39745.1 two component transcriptional regulator, LuxR family [Flavobacterium succinicans]
MQNINIHLADDHQILIDGIRALLNTIPGFSIVGTSLNGTHIFEEVTQNNTDILVLDISMPEKDGIQVLKEFAKKGFPCKVIILSSYDDLKIVKEVMKLGASGYLTKECACESIIDAINIIHSGQEYFCKSVQNKIFNTATKNNPKIKPLPLGLDVTLTERELEIMILISLEYSGKEISERLYISTNTVETHRKNIMKKIKAKNTISIVKYALKNQLIEA